MDLLNLDPGLAEVVKFTRERSNPIQEAFNAGRPVKPVELAALAGAVSALLDAIDARTRQVER